MNATGFIVFPPYRLDLADERLHRGDRALPLTPKAFAVLRFLATRAGHLVTKDEILQTVWRGTHVQDAVLKVAVREIRKALEDPARAPRFIETVHRRGYRFIAAVGQPAAGPAGGTTFVGRGSELEAMGGFLERALAGERQVVFVTGEAGIGKTTIVELFLEEAAASQHLLTGRGQCVEHSGSGMAYLPLLEALERLCRSDAGGRVLAVLRQHAPTWLAQLPAFPRAGPPGRPGAQRAVRHAGAALPGTRAGARAADGR